MALPLMLVFAASIGDMPVSYASTGKAILNGLGLTSYALPQTEEGIVWQYRMSRAVMAACNGGGTAMCGLVLQSILRNPLAEPYLLGFPRAPSLGAVCVMLLGMGKRDWREQRCVCRLMRRLCAHHGDNKRDE